jgi:hypothetical protein
MRHGRPANDAGAGPYDKNRQVNGKSRVVADGGMWEKAVVWWQNVSSAGFPASTLPGVSASGRPDIVG